MKKICFFVDEKSIVDFKLKLRHDGLSQPGFFKSIMGLYISEPDKFNDVLEYIKFSSSRFKKSKIKKTMKLYNKGVDNMKNFSLSEEEKEKVFDILEHEIGDL